LIVICPIFDILIHSGDIRDQSLKLSEIAPNFGRFWPQFLLRGTPKFGELIFPMLHISDHAAKFHGDRPRECGDLAEER